MPPIRTVPVHGPALRAIRKTRKWTLDQLATEAEMSFGYIAELERGSKRATSPETVAKLAGALRVPTEAITLPGEVAS